MRALPLLLLLGACAVSNEALLRELEERSAGREAPAGPAASSAPLRLALEPGELPTVRGAANGVPATLLLDSGSSVIVLSGELAREAALYVPPGDAGPAIAPRGPLLLRRGILDSLEMGGSRFGPLEVFVEVKERRGEWDAIIGCSLLARYRVTFDLRAGEARLDPHGRPFVPQPLFVDAQVDGRPLSLLLDSGARGLWLEPWAFEEAGRRADLVVAGRGFPGVPVRSVRTFTGIDSRKAGLLGFPSLGALEWTLDFGEQRFSVR